MRRRTILLAEDDPAHVGLITRAIDRAGCPCETEVVTNGLEAIEYLFATGPYADRDPQQVPDLFLLDLKMPKMDGLQVLQVLRRVRCSDSTRLPPAVILTSSEQDVDILRAYRLGAHSYICKPVGFSELVSTVKTVVEYWLGLNESPPLRRHGNLRGMPESVPAAATAET